MTPDPASLLERGSDILTPLFEPAGFSPREIETVDGPDGVVAWRWWVRAGEDQYVELHVHRQALRTVAYHAGTLAFFHSEYLRWRDVTGSFPGSDDDPLVAFQHLASDLQGPASELLSITPAEFEATVRRVNSMPGLSRTTNSVEMAPDFGRGATLLGLRLMLRRIFRGRDL